MFARSHGLLVAEFLDGAFVFDVATDTYHRVGPVAASLLRDDVAHTLTEIVDLIAETTGGDQSRIESEVTAGIEALLEAGLLNRRETCWLPSPVVGSQLEQHGGPLSVPLSVHDRPIIFRSREQHLLGEIEARLGADTFACRHTDREPVVFDVVLSEDGRVALHAAEVWDFPSPEAFHVQLPGAINDFAARSHSVAILHAGAVVTPSGRVLVISGAPEAGKSTLVGALVQQGCRYLSDELIGVDLETGALLPFPKPLELDETSCRALGVDAAHPPHVRLEELCRGAEALHDPVHAVDEVLMPVYRASAEFQTTLLDVEEGAKALLGQTLNMSRVLEPGLRAVCDLAAATPVTRIVHGDSVGVAAVIIESETTL